MRLLFVLALASGTPACGGVVVFDGPGGGSGAGGAGGDDGAEVATTVVGSSASGGGASATTAVSSSTGGVSCEAETCNACVSCALPTYCQGLYDASVGAPAAEAFRDCYTDIRCEQELGNRGCIEACAREHPEGFALVDAYARCIACDHCAVSCAEGWYCDLAP